MGLCLAGAITLTLGRQRVLWWRLSIGLWAAAIVSWMLSLSVSGSWLMSTTAVVVSVMLTFVVAFVVRFGRPVDRFEGGQAGSAGTDLAPS